MYTATTGIWHFGSTPLSAAIEGRGLGDHEFEPSISHTLLLIWNPNNDRRPACKIEKFVTIKREFSLSRLIITIGLSLTYHSSSEDKGKDACNDLQRDNRN